MKKLRNLFINIKKFLTAFIVLVVMIGCTSCGHYLTETGNASYYGDQFKHRPTASGKIFKQHKLTAAHKTLPFGTKVTVINLTNGKRVKVRINDRGPFVQGRIIDLTKRAARKIGMLQQGVAEVELRYKKK